MERFNGILNKAIILLGRYGYTEGSYFDLYVQRLIKMYSRPRNNVLEQDYYEEEITGEHITTEATNVRNADLTPRVKSWEDHGEEEITGELTVTEPIEISDDYAVPKLKSLVK